MTNQYVAEENTHSLTRKSAH